METEGAPREWVGREVRVQLREGTTRQGTFDEVRGVLRGVSEFGIEVEAHLTEANELRFYPWNAVRYLAQL
jgi:hypothetical protein